MRRAQKQLVMIGCCVVAIALTIAVGWVYTRDTVQRSDVAQQPQSPPTQEPSTHDQPTQTEILQNQPQQEDQSIQTEQNTPSAPIDTSTWQTYTNEEFGFSVKYPREGWDLQIVDKANERNYAVEIDTPRNFTVIIVKERTDPRHNLIVSMRITDWFDITKDYYTPDEHGKTPQIIPHETITVAGRAAITPVPNDGEKFPCEGRILTFAPAPKGWGKYNIVRTSDSCGDPESATLEAILNSLQFVQ